MIAQKDLEAAEQDYNDATAEVENSLQALKIFGVTQQEIDQAQRQGAAINPQLAVRSPIAGVVVQKLVSPGLVIQAGTTACFTISDVSTVWVQGHIYDRDLASVRIGDTVEQTNPSFTQTFHGTVSYIGALLDPATRTTPVRIVTQNPAGTAQEGHVRGRGDPHQVRAATCSSVPTSAMLRDDENEPFVYVQVEPGKFAQRLVTIGGAAGRRDGRSRAGSRRAKRWLPKAAFPAVRQQHSIRHTIMIARIVSFALSQRFTDSDGGAGADGLGRILLSRSCPSTPIPIFRRRTWRSSRSGRATRPRKSSA